MPTRRSPFQSLPISIALIIAVAVATRIVSWWNPVAHPDDQFYLFAGEQILHGHWPYVDVWDRKPLGLFLLYAGIAWIGHGTILGLNLISTAFAAATALVIRQIGLRFASSTGATLGALSYLLVIPLIGGQNGQSPVFYNLLMAGAAWLLLDATDARAIRPIRQRAFAAMLLCGLSMTIKQVSFVEGGYFGLAFLWLLHRQRQKLGSLTLTAVAMVAIALLPTALTFVGYALAGASALEAYYQASFVSIFMKSGWGWKAKLAGIGFFLLHVTPLFAMAVAGTVDRWRTRNDLAGRLLVGWVVAALLGYAAVPHFFDHYAMPVIVPLSISASTFFERASGRIFFLALVAFCLIMPPIRDWPKNAAGIAEFHRLTDQVNAARHGGCIYLADGPTRLYSATGACRLTRYVFPDHLNLYTEAGAVGIDTRMELQRVLASRPAVVLTQDVERKKHNPATDRILYPYLAAHYRPIYRSADTLPRPVQSIRIWQRRDLARDGS